MRHPNNPNVLCVPGPNCEADLMEIGATQWHSWDAAVLTAIGKYKQTGKKNRVHLADRHWRLEEAA